MTVLKFLPSPSQDRSKWGNQSGNAMVYVIIVIALFAALSFILSRNVDTGEGGKLSKERININATQIMQTAANASQAVERHAFDLVWIKDMSFIPPKDANFEVTPPANTNKIFHPSGGGLTLPPLPAEATNRVDATTAPGYYLSSFNDVEWSERSITDDAMQDAIFVAYQISRPICERINVLLNGSPDIPSLGKDAKSILIDRTYYHSASNSDFLISDCTECEGKAALCVKNPTNEIYTYYNMILQKNPLH
jgi:hypothetical protein